MAFKEITLLRGSTGLYTREDPVRITFNPETGFGGLGAAVNVVISDTGRISRRGGCTLVSSQIYHSLFPFDETRFLGVSEGTLRLIDTRDYSFKTLIPVSKNLRMSYCRVGDLVLFANGSELGIVENELAYPWLKGTDYGSSTYKQFQGPPRGNLLAYYAGSIFIAEGNTLWYSEGYSLNLFHKASGFLSYGSNIKMVEAVSTGLYISTEHEIIYLGGETPSKFKETILTDYPAIKGTAVHTSGLNLSKENRSAEPVVVFTTTKGICIGGSDAVFGSILFNNLTQDKFDYPAGSEGTACIIDNIYIVNIYV